MASAEVGERRMTQPLCQCGCGAPVGTWGYNRPSRGITKGQPKKFAYRHSRTPFQDAPTRFWLKVAKSDGCWEWTAGRSTGGYGQFKLYINGRHRTINAHRAGWLLFKGPIPDGMEVCHRCDNPPCVRLDHLFLGTISDNARDMVAKGRHDKTHKFNSTKTHCCRGHEFTPANTFRYGGHKRGCLICRSIRKQRDKRRTFGFARTTCPRCGRENVPMTASGAVAGWHACRIVRPPDALVIVGENDTGPTPQAPTNAIPKASREVLL